MSAFNEAKILLELFFVKGYKWILANKSLLQYTPSICIVIKKYQAHCGYKIEAYALNQVH